MAFAVGHQQAAVVERPAFPVRALDEIGRPKNLVDFGIGFDARHGCKEGWNARALKLHLSASPVPASLAGRALEGAISFSSMKSIAGAACFVNSCQNGVLPMQQDAP